MITIYTDGACKGNPGPGGWAYIILLHSGAQRVDSGSVPRTTNNRMELQAVVEALRHCYHYNTEDITIYSDSQIVVNCGNRAWKRKANRDLWQEVDRLVKHRTVRFEWVRGHDGHEMNERVDRLASDAAEQITYRPEKAETNLSEVEVLRQALDGLMQWVEENTREAEKLQGYWPPNWRDLQALVGQGDTPPPS